MLESSDVRSLSVETLSAKIVFVGKNFFCQHEISIP